MQLIRSNRTESLVDALASLVRREPLGPFEQETIVVQSRGMERWLALALAERLGIWGNPSFPFPRSVIEQVLDALSIGPAERSRSYDPEPLKWTIAGLLQESVPAELRDYLGASPDPDRVLRFSGKVSTVFDEYVVYRPDLLADWARGQDPEWQADLWRRVVAHLGPHDLGSRIQKALHALQSNTAGDAIRLRRLHLFSLETLPPLFLRFFAELSRVVPTTLYALEPSSEYVGDVTAAAQLALPIEGPIADGHPFLSAVGGLARDFQKLLMSVDDAVQSRLDLFQAPARTNLLHSIQADILEFRAPPTDESRKTFETSDPSISIHACTGPMREAQVVHELVRAALEDDPQLEPHEVVVMTPDLETYAPLFRAVFGQTDAHRIPYEVHDRKARDDTSFYEDFLAVLEVLDSRFSVLDVVRLMDSGSMRGEFRFTSDERARLAELLAAAGVRWGIDPEHRRALDFPAAPLHTWRAGLGRLFLGFASVPEVTEVFAGLLPRGALTLQDAELVARLSRLCEVLFEFHRLTREPIEVRGWVKVLTRLSASLFEEENDGGSIALHTLWGALHDLEDLASRGGYGGALLLKTIRRELGAQVLRKTPAVGFLRRGVTLTELVPLRSVPFRVVCLVGMSEESFPRADDRPSFDRTRRNYRSGDRNRRLDDRQSFLQALLCARDRLIITYSSPANSSRAVTNASPVVFELCEAANRYYALPGGKPALETTAHPLHAFDWRYFDGGALPQSFSQRTLRITQALAEPPTPRPRVELLREAEDRETAVSVGELGSWLWNPMRTFIDKVLRARFDRSELYEPTGELTGIGPLEASIVGNHALYAGLHGEALEEYLAAAPEFPDGNWGAIARRALAAEIRAVDALDKQVHGEVRTRSRFLTASVGGITLEGRLDGLSSEHRILKRFTRKGGKAELTAWIEHLLMQAAREDEALPRTTHLILRSKEKRGCLVCFAPVEDPRALLEILVTSHRVSQTAPLPLLETSSRAFAEAYLKDGEERAIQAARAELRKQRRWDDRLQYVLGADDPFEDEEWTEAFHRAAITVYQPLLEHRSEP
ncbi:MAG: exodeoxyribonuclease V subunit gamma [Polyangiales bacterium]